MPRTATPRYLLVPGRCCVCGRVMLRRAVPGWGAELGCRVAGEAPVTPPVTLPVAVSGEAARVRIMVRYILERHRSERSAGFTCGVGCLPF